MAFKKVTDKAAIKESTEFCLKIKKKIQELNYSVLKCECILGTKTIDLNIKS